MGGGVWGSHGPDHNLGARFTHEYSRYESQFKEFIIRSDLSELLPVAGVIIIAVVIVGIILSILAFCFIAVYMAFISFPTAVGQNRFYLDNRKGRADAGKLLSSFGADYRNIVKVMFLKNLRVFLWSLLFIVPGIIKGIQYMMVDYLMAEYPKMELDRALKLSRGITDGQKWAIFKLYLSFLGWFILCLITAGIGFVFLNPYIQATFAELYAVLIDKQMGDNPENPNNPENPADTGALPEASIS